MRRYSLPSDHYSLPFKKRLFDVAVCLILAPVWLPVLIVATVLLLLWQGKPVFYVSPRVVVGNTAIRLWKYRTMVPNAATLIERDRAGTTNGALFLNVQSTCGLYTRIGRIYERLQLTELPQIAHVLLGQMSLVGARPLPRRVIAALQDTYPFAADRFMFAAGLTGPVQLVGRDFLSDLNRLRLEIAYCECCLNHYCIGMDVRVLAYTVLMVLGLRSPMTVAEAFAFINSYRVADAVAPAWVLEAPSTNKERP